MPTSVFLTAVLKRVNGLTAILVVLTGLGFLGRLWWVFDLFAAFRVYYALAAGVLLLLSSLRPGRWSILAAVLLLINGVSVASLFFATEFSHGPGLRVMSFNVKTSNRARAAVRQEILRHRPHVLFMIEVDRTWRDALHDLEDYRLIASEFRSDNFGMAVWSRIGVDHHAVIAMGRFRVPAFEVTVHWQNRPVRLLGVHTVPPVNAEYSAARDAHLQEIVTWARSATVASAVLGDLNVTPFSPVFEVLRMAGLRRVNTGLSSTWPADLGLPWSALMLPLDHVFIGPGLSVVQFTVGDSSGSDHRPIIVDLTPARASDDG